MCVNKDNYTCCCCSLTTATYILGILQLLGTIAYASTSQWPSFTCQLICTLCFIMVFVNPNDSRTRKILFYCVSIGQLISILTTLAVFLYLLFTDDWIDDACKYPNQTLAQYNTCVDWAKSGLIVGFCWVMAIMLLFQFMIWQVLYYGWKEQEEKDKENYQGQKGGVYDGEIATGTPMP